MLNLSYLDSDPSYLPHNFYESAFYVKLYIMAFIVLCIIGVCGNASVILVILFDKNFQEVRNLFLVSLSTADLLVSGSIMPASIAGVLLGKHQTETNRAVCNLTAFICAPSCIASIYSIVWIAVSRYYYITKYSVYMKYFTKAHVVSYVSLIWFMALMVHLPNHYGWGKIHYSTVLRFCTVDTELFSYLLFYASFLLSAIVLSFVYYTKIYLVLRKTTLARGMILGSSGQGKGDKEKGNKENTAMSNLQNETKMIKATFKIFVLFFICWAPLTILFFLRFLCRVPLWAFLYAAMLAHGNSTLNFLVYFTSNENFVLALKKFAGKFRRPIIGAENELAVIAKSSTKKHTTRV